MVIGTSVIVHYLNVMRLAVPPDEADSPLVIDPNAMLTGTITLERLDAVSRRNAKVIQPLCGMKVE